jgi:hypothetical protein
VNSQVLALLGCVSMQKQVGKKRLGAAGIERLQPLLPEAQIDTAQETGRAAWAVARGSHRGDRISPPSMSSPLKRYGGTGPQASSSGPAATRRSTRPGDRYLRQPGVIGLRRSLLRWMTPARLPLPPAACRMRRA